MGTLSTRLQCTQKAGAWSFDEWKMTGDVLDVTKVGNKCMTLPQAHFRLEVWMSVPPVIRSGLNG